MNCQISQKSRVKGLKSVNGSAAHVIMAGIVIAAAAAGIYFSLDKPAETSDMLGLDEIGRIDPGLIIFSQVRTLAVSGVPGAEGIALDTRDSLYVCGEREYAVFDHEGLETGRVNYSSPGTCIGVDGNGIVYIGHRDHVEVFEKGGSKARWKPLGNAAYITSLCAGEEDVYVADAGNRVVVRYGKDGTEKGRITGKPVPNDNKGFIVPSGHFDLFVENDDYLWIVNPGYHRLQNYTPEGSLRGDFGDTGKEIEKFCGCCNPCDFTMMKDGRFVTVEKGLVRVKLYAQDGAFLGVVAGPDSFSKGVAGMDVAADSKDYVYVLDAKAERVLIFKEQSNMK